MDLCTLLEEHGFLSHAQAETIRTAASQTSDPLVRHVLESRLVPEEDLVRLLAFETGCEIVDPRPLSPLPEVVHLVPWEVASRQMVLPLRILEDRRQRPLEVLLADPLDHDLIEDLEEQVGAPIVVSLARPSFLARAIERAYSGLVTRVVRREEAPPGGRAAAPPVPGQITDPITVPSHSILDEATSSVKLEALIGLLEDKGLITREEYVEQVRTLLAEHEEEEGPR